MPTVSRSAAATPADTAVREMVIRRHRQRRSTLVSLAALVIVLAAALVGGGVVRAGARAPGRLPRDVPTAATGDHTGFSVSSGSARVDLYVDYLCPACRQVEDALAPELNALQKNGAASIVYHPVAFLDDKSSPSGYSTRAAAAVACAAQAGRFAPYSDLLFAQQPAENGPGLTTEQLIALSHPAGILETASGTFARCIRAATFTPWVAYATDMAAARQVTVTPTVFVAGRRVDVTGTDPGAALARAVTKARS